MVEFVITMAVLGVVGLLGLVGGGMYLADPKGWQATIKRVSRTFRANLEAGRKTKAVGRPEDIIKGELEEWDAEFQGKSLAPVKPKVFVHEIVETWFSPYADIGVEHYWKCSCGNRGKRWVESLARQDSKEHVKTYNRAEQAKASGSKLQW